MKTLFKDFKKISFKAIYLNILFVILFSIGGCSKLSFSSKPISESFLKSLNTLDTDLLFVVDDSCSMNSIITNVRNGIDSIDSVSFPAGTRMAVTYMSPARINNGVTDFSTPYNQFARLTPGHVQLVSRSSIQTYLDLDVSAYDPTGIGKTRFTLQGCDSSWFEPNEKNELGESCLKGHMQSPLYCTGVEAGTQSLIQLIERYSQSRIRLFRPKSLVNIVFISDTHDAGATYYGNPNAATERSNLSQLVDVILTNSPDVVSVKFNGIVPLPVVGDPKLNGLNVIGLPPQTPEEAYINEEGTWNHTYLEYIRGSEGVALHAKRDDWSEAMRELIRSSGVVTQLTIKLSQRAKEIESIFVAGKLHSKDKYRVHSDMQTVTLFELPKGVTALDVTVVYSPEEN